MKERWIILAMAVVFLVVGVLATANTIRLNRYIEETMPRDQAQEDCNSHTIEVLKTWLLARSERDAAMDTRDDAAVATLEDILANGEASTEHITDWRNAVANDRKVRAEANEQRGPIPKC